MLVVVPDAAAFVPTTGWRHLATHFVLALLTLRLPIFEIVLVRLPESREELIALVMAEDGLLLDESWAWDPSGRMLFRRQSKDVLTTKLPPPYSERWATLASDPAARRRVMRKILFVSLATVAALIGISTAAWRVTGDSDLLVAGLFFAGIVIVGVTGGLVVASRAGKQLGDDVARYLVV
jgi:hypothetical protein